MKRIIKIKVSWIIVLMIFLQLGIMNIGWSQVCPNLYESWTGTQRKMPCDVSPCDSPSLKEILYYQEGLKDPNAGFSIFPSHSEKVLKLGDQSGNYNLINIGRYDVANSLTTENNKFIIRYSLVVKETPNGGELVQGPGFSVTVHDAEFFTCQNAFGINFNGLKKKGEYYYQEWTTIPVDFSAASIAAFPSIFFSFNTGHYKNANGINTPLIAYIYIDVQCIYPELEVPAQVCKGEPISILAPFEAHNPSSFSWMSGDGEMATGKLLTHTYPNVGTYTVTMDYSHNNVANNFCRATKYQHQISVIACKETPPFVCETCIPDFSPLPGERYIISAWVRQGNGIGYSSYDGPGVRISFLQGTVTEKFRPTGSIVDGWQQINGEFVVPENATKISIQLSNDNASEEIFFDDIRIQPFNSSLKSFVYDPVTLRLAAELDERNFASFFEYDEEGGLVRVKKETERGVKTISESRTSLRKRKPAQAAAGQ